MCGRRPREPTCPGSDSPAGYGRVRGWHTHCGVLNLSSLLVGFDSAWTPSNSGALVGALRDPDGPYVELGPPRPVSFAEAEEVIRSWQSEFTPRTTLILLDQPTVVRNAAGQRPVENIVGSPVSLRYGGVQPANTGRREMFDADAPIWGFLSAFGCDEDPAAGSCGTRVLETYPVLAMIALGWVLPDVRTTGRLPKYNPARRSTFSLADWQHVCSRTAAELHSSGLSATADWVERAGQNTVPRKQLQDCVDACVCLLVASQVAEGRDALIVGQQDSGYMIVPDDAVLRRELVDRCILTGRSPAAWVQGFRV